MPMNKPKPGATKIAPMANPRPKAKPSAAPTLPTLAEFKQSAAYKNGGLTYKQYLEYYKARGAK